MYNLEEAAASLMVEAEELAEILDEGSVFC